MAKKVLVIEDDSCIRMLLLQILKDAFEDSLDNEKLELLEASDGELGFQMAQNARPDLIFSDIMMPKMDGFEVCRKVKNDDNLKGVYFVLITASQEVDKIKMEAVGCEEFMTKPYDFEQIILTVENVLGIKRDSS
ncbi:MAG: response regulator [Candidatus Anammoxibacter sp.]